MSHLPITPISPEQQQKMLGQMYLLMDKQVKSYQKHRHMGSSSSVPVELAQELMESIAYTINQAGGLHTYRSVEEALRVGQACLEEIYRKAESMLELVNATAPRWQTECRWEALRYLGNYLTHYDHLHLAHKGPDGLYYPILISPPEGIQGIDSCLFYLHILWIENQIMAGFSEETLESFWDRLPAATLNQCEPLLLNGMAKALLGAGLDPLLLEQEEYIAIVCTMTGIAEEVLKNAAHQLCDWLQLTDESARQYVYAIISQLLFWAENGCSSFDSIFL